MFYGAFVDTDDGVGLAVSCSGYGEKHLALLFTPATADFDKSPDADTDMTFDIDGKSLTIFTAFVAAADGRLAATHVPGAHTELAEVYDALSGAKKAIKVSLYNYETDDLVEATFSADGVQEALKTLFDNCPY